ncbi:autotransporter outer membrane beta-barrel domain-containing protein [Endomicrobium proavitum]|uniref:Autotransporter domain-containing protein n=1 Tax=Endomicrobium proavitum TaxID=1408281 RepID=A0A0G3WGF0_9BACT|nr:autotransporter outer membrane beta-barrel domain-containing protein [Endomicrobium proavitum]AKL97751.1 exported protein of unknown function [Endomicrobium proavitum]
MKKFLNYISDVIAGKSKALKVVAFSLFLLVSTLFLAAPKTYAQIYLDDMIAQNYSYVVGSSGIAALPWWHNFIGALNVNSIGGYVQYYNLINKNISLLSNTLTSGDFGTAAQGGGLFVGGSVSAGEDHSLPPAMWEQLVSGGEVVVNIISSPSIINFTSNTLTSGDFGTAAQGGGLFVGGAVSAGINYTSLVSSFGFASNGMATVNITLSTVNFTGNTLTAGVNDQGNPPNGAAAQGGGLFVGGAVSAGNYSIEANSSASSSTAVVNFTSSTVNFTGNTLTAGNANNPWNPGENRRAAQGGGLFVGGAVSAGFGADAMDAVNFSSSGTAIAAFTDSIINVGNNSAMQGGGLFVGGSVAGGSSREGRNYATNGIAQLTFTGSTVTIYGNNAGEGGGIYITGNSGDYGANYAADGWASIIFENSAVSISNNTAQYGAAIFAVNGASITFDNNTSVEFLWNNSLYGNGVVDFQNAPNFGLQNANITKAIGNQSNNGGFLYLVNQGTWTFTNAEMSSNTARGGQGGALYLSNTNVVFNEESTLSYNTATSVGGAVFANNTILTIKNAVMTFMNNKSLLGGAVYASNGSSITLSGRGSFIGNEANASSGAAIYITGGSTVTVEAASGDILFTGNKAAGTPNDIYADNNTQLNLITSGTNTISLAGGILSNAAGTGIVVNKTGAGTLLLGGDNVVYGDFIATEGKVGLISNASYTGNSLILTGAEFDMTDDDASRVNIASVTTFTSITKATMGIFANGENDTVYAGSATIDGALYIKTGLGDYGTQKTYDLIISTTFGINQIYGVFASSAISNTTLQYTLDYSNPGIVRLTVAGGAAQSNFAAIKQLTPNQREVAKTWDSLSVILSSGDLLNVMNGAWNNTTTDEEKKGALNIASGYFLSNVIKSAALDSDNNELYNRIKSNAQSENSKAAIWTQATGASAKFGRDKNSLEEYTDGRYGATAGIDVHLGAGNVMLGIYADYKDHSISEKNSKATLNKIGGGLYGGYVSDEWEIKTIISASKDKYETSRYIELSKYLPLYADRIANASYEGMTIGADIEGALKIKISNNTTFKPYIGVEVKNAQYDSFKETGASGLNLNVAAGNYLRSVARLGSGVSYDNKTWAGYIDFEGKFLLIGAMTEIKSMFENTELEFTSRGYSEGVVACGVGIGGSVRITEWLKLFVNGNFYRSNKFTNLYGNAGLNFSFGSVTNKGSNQPNSKQEPAPTPAPERSYNDDDLSDELRNALSGGAAGNVSTQPTPKPAPTPAPERSYNDDDLSDELRNALSGGATGNVSTQPTPKPAPTPAPERSYNDDDLSDELRNALSGGATGNVSTQPTPKPAPTPTPERSYNEDDLSDDLRNALR